LASCYAHVFVLLSIVTLPFGAGGKQSPTMPHRTQFLECENRQQ